jgi:multiple sugar transport system permease protein
MGISDSNIIWTSMDGNQAIFLLIVIDTWTVLPSVMIILLAGLQGFNEEYKEAAYVFGATKRQTLVDIVVPIMKPTIITSILLRLIAALQVWLIAVLMFGFGRVPFLVERLVYYASNRGEVSSAEKYSYTYSLIVVVLVMIISMSYLRFANRNKRKVQ